MTSINTRSALHFVSATLIAASIFCPFDPALGQESRASRRTNDAIARIIDEGMNHSEAMTNLSYLCDVIGPRLTGSPNVKRANEWTRDQLAAWGLQNAHLEPWGPFGRGWSQDFVSVRMTAPDVAPLYAIPFAWSPGTNGVVNGKAMIVKVDSIEDLDK